MAEENEAHEEEETSEEEEASEEEFDQERALATIKKQRAAERKLKEELREARKAQAELDKIKQDQEDAEKSATDKLAERDTRIAELEQKIQESAVKADFEKVAADRGIADLALAYLAAKEQGLLGKIDPKTGTVGEHDLDKLEDLYPALAGEDRELGRTGEAGVRGKPGKTGSVGSQFNSVIRAKVSGR